METEKKKSSRRGQFCIKAILVWIGDALHFFYISQDLLEFDYLSITQSPLQYLSFYARVDRRYHSHESTKQYQQNYASDKLDTI